jgi:hypothetical protein
MNVALVAGLFWLVFGILGIYLFAVRCRRLQELVWARA